MPPYVRNNRSLVSGYITPNQRNILTTDCMIKKLLRQVAHRQFRFGQYQQSTGIFINPVYQPKSRKRTFSNPGIFLLQVPRYTVQ